METPDLGSINFSENMTAAFDTSMDNNSAANKIFTITSGIDESKVRHIYQGGGHWSGNYSSFNCLKIMFSYSLV